VTGEDESIRASYEALERRAAQNRGEPLRKKIADQVAIWRHNRKLYPGWVVAPWSNRALLYNLTSAWVGRIVEGSADAQPGEQIVWLRELTWRLDVCLLPLDGRLAHAAEAALERCGFSDAETPAHPPRSLRYDVESTTALLLPRPYCGTTASRETSLPLRSMKRGFYRLRPLPWTCARIWSTSESYCTSGGSSMRKQALYWPRGLNRSVAQSGRFAEPPLWPRPETQLGLAWFRQHSPLYRMRYRGARSTKPPTSIFCHAKDGP
jgi:hypothetical protein